LNSFLSNTFAVCETTPSRTVEIIDNAFLWASLGVNYFTRLMPVFKRPLSFLNRNAQTASGSITPNAKPSALQSPASAPQQPKTLAQLEQEMAAEAQVLPTRPIRHSPSPIKRTFNKIKWTVVLLGIPAGMVWFVNLPYPIIRRPVAEAAPILLLPSYISMDNHYRQAIASRTSRATDQQCHQSRRHRPGRAKSRAGTEKPGGFANRISQRLSRIPLLVVRLAL
jgi:hypothetical protein